MRIILGFIGVVMALWFLWYLTGGPERYDGGGKFLKPPTPLDTGESYDAESIFRNPNR